MSPEDYCYNFAAPPGSDFRYSLLGLPLKRRQALLALKAFCLETAQIVSECRDTVLPETKLDWWRTEMDRLFAGEPQHPVTRASAGRLQISICQKSIFGRFWMGSPWIWITMPTPVYRTDAVCASARQHTCPVGCGNSGLSGSTRHTPLRSRGRGVATAI
jgi:hypothetical protein